MAQELTVGLAGLGAIGSAVADALLAGKVPGLRLAAVSARDVDKAKAWLAEHDADLPVVPLGELPDHAEILVEALPAAVFDELARPAVEAGRTLVVASGGAMIGREDLVAKAEETGARLVIVSGAILGLDGVRAAAEGQIERVTFKTSKPPKSLKDAPYVQKQGIDLEALTEATCIFEGSVREAIKGFPANVNVAAAASLAGIGPERTMIEVWADPAAERATHSLSLEGEAARFTLEVQGMPSPDNPATGMLTPLSVIATLRRLTAPLVVGN